MELVNGVGQLTGRADSSAGAPLELSHRRQRRIPISCRLWSHSIGSGRVVIRILCSGLLSIGLVYSTRAASTDGLDVAFFPVLIVASTVILDRHHAAFLDYLFPPNHHLLAPTTTRRLLCLITALPLHNYASSCTIQPVSSDSTCLPHLRSQPYFF